MTDSKKIEFIFQHHISFQGCFCFSSTIFRFCVSLLLETSNKPSAQWLLNYFSFDFNIFTSLLVEAGTVGRIPMERNLLLK